MKEETNMYFQFFIFLSKIQFNLFQFLITSYFFLTYVGYLSLLTIEIILLSSVDNVVLFYK